MVGSCWCLIAVVVRLFLSRVNRHYDIQKIYVQYKGGKLNDQQEYAFGVPFLAQHFIILFSAMIAHKVNVSHTFVLPSARLRQQ